MTQVSTDVVFICAHPLNQYYPRIALHPSPRMTQVSMDIVFICAHPLNQYYPRIASSSFAPVRVSTNRSTKTALQKGTRIGRMTQASTDIVFICAHPLNQHYPRIASSSFAPVRVYTKRSTKTALQKGTRIWRMTQVSTDIVFICAHPLNQ